MLICHWFAPSLSLLLLLLVSCRCVAAFHHQHSLAILHAAVRIALTSERRRKSQSGQSQGVRGHTARKHALQASPIERGSCVCFLVCVLASLLMWPLHARCRVMRARVRARPGRLPAQPRWHCSSNSPPRPRTPRSSGRARPAQGARSALKRLSVALHRPPLLRTGPCARPSVCLPL